MKFLLMQRGHDDVMASSRSAAARMGVSRAGCGARGGICSDHADARARDDGGRGVIYKPSTAREALWAEREARLREARMRGRRRDSGEAQEREGRRDSGVRARETKRARDRAPGETDELVVSFVLRS